MNRFIGMVIAAMCLTNSGTEALAVCGDVTGDERVTTTDALTVLQFVVGSDPPMTCDEGTSIPASTIQFFNDFSCANGTVRRSAILDGRVRLAANVNEFSRAVEWTEPDVDLTGDLCGFPWSLSGPLFVAPGRRLVVIEVVRDDEVYDWDIIQNLFWIDILDFGPVGGCPPGTLCSRSDHQPRLIGRYPVGHTK